VSERLSPQRSEPYNSSVPPLDANARAEALVALLDGVASDDLRAWLRDVWAAAGSGPRFDSVATAFSSASRRLRGVGIGARPETLRELGLDKVADGSADHVLRVALLLRACRDASPVEQGELVMRLFRTGDTAERCAVLDAIELLPDPQACVETAVEACRSNVQDVFEAIACENDYPAQWFSDDAFNQMIMKAVFSGIPLERVRGLACRVNSELRRMAADYVRERRAAGRPVPADLARLGGEGAGS
jgi:hypothetical protein